MTPLMPPAAFIIRGAETITQFLPVSPSTKEALRLGGYAVAWVADPIGTILVGTYRAVTSNGDDQIMVDP